MEKLAYKNLANVNILIDLGNEYSVVAMGVYNKSESKYDVNFWIKNNMVDRLDLMEELHFSVKSTVKNYGFVKHEILKAVTDMNEKNRFEKYIKRTEYEIGCEH